jgi:Fuc2NAc and GlcNAc transferase
MGDSGNTFLEAFPTLSRRILNRENIFEAHRKHLYQRLQQTGLAHSTVASLYIILNMSFA